MNRIRLRLVVVVMSIVVACMLGAVSCSLTGVEAVEREEMMSAERKVHFDLSKNKVTDADPLTRYRVPVSSGAVQHLEAGAQNGPIRNGKELSNFDQETGQRIEHPRFDGETGEPVVYPAPVSSDAVQHLEAGAQNGPIYTRDGKELSNFDQETGQRIEHPRFDGETGEPVPYYDYWGNPINLDGNPGQRIEHPRFDGETGQGEPVSHHDERDNLHPLVSKDPGTLKYKIAGILALGGVVAGGVEGLDALTKNGTMRMPWDL